MKGVSIALKNHCVLGKTGFVPEHIKYGSQMVVVFRVVVYIKKIQRHF